MVSVPLVRFELRNTRLVKLRISCGANAWLGMQAIMNKVSLKDRMKSLRSQGSGAMRVRSCASRRHLMYKILSAS